MFNYYCYFNSNKIEEIFRNNNNMFKAIKVPKILKLTDSCLYSFSSIKRMNSLSDIEEAIKTVEINLKKMNNNPPVEVMQKSSYNYNPYTNSNIQQPNPIYKSSKKEIKKSPNKTYPASDIINSSNISYNTRNENDEKIVKDELNKRLFDLNIFFRDNSALLSRSDIPQYLKCGNIGIWSDVDCLVLYKKVTLATIASDIIRIENKINSYRRI